ncbi:hypothetical protein RI543_000175 [Arxiozyma heterogenica]|uniref:Cell wall mannoprotein PIR1-like C-terminal domain-containing protein n=1 Tax=Arxiozyma heterogenica TaxID=278026 RepID=A0AAN7WPG5_9SACH|nr:hypothetical protein RI543_000175 [Kazachstania heterogenica]
MYSQFIFHLIATIFLVKAIYLPSEPWVTLTPTKTCQNGLKDYATDFGIIINSFVQNSESTLPCNSVATQTFHYVTLVNQIPDGQIHCTKDITTPVLQIKDGQIQAFTAIQNSNVETSTENKGRKSFYMKTMDKTCKTDSILTLKLDNGVLTDHIGRIGSIVSNRQFQFDGPPPQAGAIYAAGWSITNDGYLALGDSDIFYQCLSGNFYNLYDESIGGQCSQIHLQITNLITC